MRCEGERKETHSNHEKARKDQTRAKLLKNKLFIGLVLYNPPPACPETKKRVGSNNYYNNESTLKGAWSRFCSNSSFMFLLLTMLK